MSSRIQPYGFDIPSQEERGATIIYKEIFPDSVICESLACDTINLSGHTITYDSQFKFAGPVHTEKVLTDELVVNGEVYSPAQNFDLISEQSGKIIIDGELKIKHAQLSYEDGKLKSEKSLDVPGIIIDERDFAAYIQFAQDETHLLKDTIIGFPHILAIHSHELSSDPNTSRLTLSSEFQAESITTKSGDDTAHLSNISVIGAGIQNAFTHKESSNGPVALTIGGENSNDYKLCVRGRIVADGIDNSGFNSYTLFHHCEHEGESVVGLIGRVFSWTGIPRLIHPTTGEAVNNWKQLHHAHALSSVLLSSIHNDDKVAGVLHEICAAKEDEEFNIYAPHGETRHKYHGERDLLRIAGAGDHLVWCCQGGYELSAQMLSGMWEKSENGVSQGEVLLNVNTDFSFSITDSSLLERVLLLEAKIQALLNI